MQRIIHDFEEQFRRPAPGDDHFYDWKTLALLCQGKYEEAKAMQSDNFLVNLALKNYAFVKEESVKIAENNIGVIGHGVALASLGQRDSAMHFIKKLQLQEKLYVHPVAFAAIYKALGDEKMADAYIEKAFKVRDNFLHLLPVLEPYHSFRDDPKVKEIIARSWVPLK